MLLTAGLHATGLKLTAEVANTHVRRWLYEVVNARVHGATKAAPVRPGRGAAVMLRAPDAESGCEDAAASTAAGGELAASAGGI